MESKKGKWSVVAVILAVLCVIDVISVGYLYKVRKTTDEKMQALSESMAEEAYAGTMQYTVIPTATPEPEPTAVPECQHEWRDGVCTKCFEVCNHERHDEMTAMCLHCGKPMFHKYDYDHICYGCDKRLHFYTDWIPAEYFTPCEHEGKVETFELVCSKHDPSKNGWRKIDVYTPYKYDPSQKYNVLILQPGLHEDNTVITTRPLHFKYPAPAEGACGRYIFDHMFDLGDCEPMIIVSLDGLETTYDGGRWQSSFDSMWKSIHDDVLPFVVSHYSTYAASPSIEDIRLARDHFAYGGTSNGGYHTYYVAMRCMLDCFSNFIPIYGSIQGVTVAKAMDEKFPDYDVKMFVAGVGVDDSAAYKQTVEDYQDLIGASSKLFPGINCFLVESQGAHEWRAASTALYNGMRAIFPYIEGVTEMNMNGRYSTRVKSYS